MNTSLQMLTELASFIFLASLKATVLAALVLLMQRLAGPYLSAGARYLLWLSVVIGLVTPVGFDTVLPASLVPEMPIAVSSEPDIVYPAAPESRAIRNLEATAPAAFAMPVERDLDSTSAAPLPWWSYAWLAGVLAVLAAIALSSHRLACIVQRATLAPPEVQQLLQACMQQSRYSARVRVLQSADVQVPMIAGLLRPALLLPQGLEQRVARDQLRHIFIHELMHLRRGDIASNWIVALVQALHWFNPFIWYAFFRMRLDRELACDAATLKQLAPSDRAAYGRTLLQLNDTLPQTPMPAVALGILDSSSHLQTRILMLVQFSRRQRLQSLVATLLFLALGTAAFSQPSSRATEPVAVAEPAAPRVEPATPVVEVANVQAPEPEIRQPEPVPAVPAAEPVITTLPAAAQAAPVEPALQEPAQRAPGDDSNNRLLAQLAPAAAADPVTVEAPAAEPVATDAPISPAQLDADLTDAIKRLAEEISAAQSASIPFIEDLEAAAVECAAKGDGFFATLGKACTKTRRALRRGQLFYFGYQCYVLESRQEDLAKVYRDSAGTGELEDTLRMNEEALATFCSKDTYAAQYPAFASLFEEAESLEYFQPGARSVALDFNNRIFLEQRGTASLGNFNWYDIGNGFGGGGIADMYSANASGVVPINSISTTGDAPAPPPAAAVAE